MRTFIRGTNLLLLVLFCTAGGISATYGAGGDDFHAVATYECIGLYFNSTDLGTCEVSFRQDGETDWREGYPLVFDPRDNQYRGSRGGIGGRHRGQTLSYKLALDSQFDLLYIWPHGSSVTYML